MGGCSCALGKGRTAWCRVYFGAKYFFKYYTFNKLTFGLYFTHLFTKKVFFYVLLRNLVTILKNEIISLRLSDLTFTKRKNKKMKSATAKFLLLAAVL